MHQRRHQQRRRPVASIVRDSDCSRSAASGETGWPGEAPPVRACSRANAWSGERPSTGTSESSSVLTRTAACGDLVAGAVAHLLEVEADPSSTALAWAPRSSDSAVCAGVVRRSPRSRSITSMPSRVEAKADGTPSSSVSQARGSGRGGRAGSVDGWGTAGQGYRVTSSAR